MTVPIYLDNPLSVECIETAATSTHRVVLTVQHSWGYPATPDDLYDVGTIGEIAQVLRLPDGSVHVIVRTTDVVRLNDTTVEKGIFTANV